MVSAYKGKPKEKYLGFVERSPVMRPKDFLVPLAQEGFELQKKNAFLFYNFVRFVFYFNCPRMVCIVLHSRKDLMSC